MLTSPRGVVDLAGHDLHRPRAVGALHRRHPVVGPLGGLDLAADQQRHRGLDVVPDVDVLPTVHGTAPQGSCIEAIDAAVSATWASVRTSRT